MRLILTVAASILLTACAGARPEIPPQAAISAPRTWRTHLGTPSSDVSSAWWQIFHDPALTNVVETALNNNPDIAIAATRVAEAQAQFRLSHAQLLPDVAASIAGGRNRDINPGFGIPEEQTAGQGEVSISYDTDLFGRLANVSEAARAEMLSSEAARDNIHLAVAASAASGYITLRALDDRLAVLHSTLLARSESLKIARRRTQAGYSSQLDLAQAEADYRATEELIPAAELAISQQEDGLSVLLGHVPQAIVRGSDLRDMPPPVVPGLLPADLVRRRPDIIAAEEQLIAADRSLDSSRAAFMPNVSISISGGYVGSTLIVSPESIWSLGGSILAPIFDSGRLQAQQDVAAARRDRAAFAYRKSVLGAFREVEDALATIDRTDQEVQALRSQRNVLATSLSLATNRYRSGYASYLDQIDAQRGLLSADLALVQLRADQLNAIVTLYQAIGGGWPSNISP